MSKKSIRFFNDRQVRAVWDEENNNSIQLVSVTHEFKFEAPDGKQRNADANVIKTLLKGALTDRINNREIFMKGIDYFLTITNRRINR